LLEILSDWQISIPATRVRTAKRANFEDERTDELRRVIDEFLNDRLFMQELFNSMEYETDL
jgi:hypothetical protein